MRVKAAVNIVISNDDDQTEKLGPDVDVVIDDSTPTHERAGILDFAANAAEIQYAFSPEVTNGKYLIVQVLSGEVQIKFNSNVGTPFNLKQNPAVAVDPIMPYQAAAQPGVLVLGPLSPTNPVTSLYLKNASTTATARIAIAVVGEAS